MPAFKSAYLTKLDASAASRNTSANADDIALHHKKAHITYTGAGTETAGDYIRLAVLNTPNARVVPEACKLRFAGTGTINCAFTLKSLSATGTLTALTAATADVAALTSTVSFAAPSGGGDTLALNAGDELRLYISAPASGTAHYPLTTHTIIAEVAYDAPGC